MVQVHEWRQALFGVRACVAGYDHSRNNSEASAYVRNSTLCTTLCASACLWVGHRWSVKTKTTIGLFNPPVVVHWIEIL